MKTKLLRKIRKKFLIKYVIGEYKYSKELFLFNIKTNVIKINRWEGVHTVPDLFFVLEELGESRLIKKYWAKKAWKTFKRL